MSVAFCIIYSWLGRWSTPCTMIKVETSSGCRQVSRTAQFSWYVIFHVSSVNVVQTEVRNNFDELHSQRMFDVGRELIPRGDDGDRG